MYSLSAGFFIVNLELYLGCCSELNKKRNRSDFFGVDMGFPALKCRLRKI